MLLVIDRNKSGKGKFIMTNLIKALNDSLKEKDPVLEAIKEVDQTHLEDEQVEMLADYMREMIHDAKVRGSLIDLQDAAGMALEDVAGFETAPKKVLQATVARLMKAYIAKYGNA